MQIAQNNVPPNEEEEIGSLSGFKFNERVQTKIIEMINNQRVTNGSPSLDNDPYAQNVILEKMSIQDSGTEKLKELMARDRLAFRDFQYIENDLSVPPLQPGQYEGRENYKSFVSLSENTINNYWEQLIKDQEITHIGVCIKKDFSRIRIGILYTKQ